MQISSKVAEETSTCLPTSARRSVQPLNPSTPGQRNGPLAHHAVLLAKPTLRFRASSFRPLLPFARESAPHADFQLAH